MFDVDDQELHDEAETVAEEVAREEISKRQPVRRGRFIVNLTSNVALFAVNIVIGIWYTPYLIHHLGAAGYGIVPLVTQIVGYMGVITLGLNAAVGRYITIAIERGEDDAANRYFNTSFFGSLILAMLLVVPAAWAALHAEILINVPADEIVQTRWLFACAAVVFLVNTVRSPYGVSTYCLNRFDLRNGLSLVDRIVSIAVVVWFFTFATPQIWNVGLGLLAASCVTWVGTGWFWRMLTPQLRVSFSHFTFKTLRELVSTGAWLSINYIGMILYLGIDLLVVNRMFGPDAGGRYAAVMQWSSLLRMLAVVLAGVFGPTMLAYYARHDIDGLTLYGRRAVKFVGLLIALPIGLICGLSTPLLQTWLGPKFADLAWLMSLMTVHLSVNLAVIPLFGIQTATNRLRAPGIVTFVMGAGNLGLAIFLAGPMGWGLYGVAAAGAIVLTAKNLIFTPLYAAHILGRRLDAFLWEMLPITLATLGTAATCKLLAATWDISGWPRLIAAGAAISVVYAAIGYWILLNRKERKLAWSMVRCYVPIGIDEWL
jgi:membrane protein EpsK